MTNPPQIGFRISPELHESFKAKVEAENSTVTKVLTELINQYLAADKIEAQSPSASSRTTTSSAPHLNSAESYQHSYRVDNLERLVVSMLDTSALANRIASLEIRLLDAIKLLERYTLTADNSWQVTASTRQTPSNQAASADNSALQSRLTEVENQLANQQQLLSKQIEQQLADLLADIKDQLADQLTHQNEQARNLEQSFTDQQSEFTAALTEVESRLSDRLNQHAAQFTILNQVITNLQNSSQPSAQKSTSKQQAGEAPNTNSKPNSSAKNKEADVSHSQPSQSSVNAEIDVEDGYVVVNGVRKRLLLPKEAMKIAKEHGFEGDDQALAKLSRPRIRPETYARYGLGVVPELRGGRGTRKAWYYEI
ncbi:hypothetical protein H6F88_01155 [Oculatella sp. FACHB-28]|uniref:hypothetical protein n=1 Tax=Oculatella sp. FACHB-28 TaxID=2692845 RepID=UPI0016899056|nr:hypothetical protein [Oculatella sp. FACHB-28]MBD2054649.1 hypothetical protein [Oculatella sp. FACHB-28]